VNLWRSLTSQRDTVIGGTDAYNAYMAQHAALTSSGVTQTLAGNVERVGSDYASLIAGGYAANGVIFACMAVRQQAFSAVRLQYQRLRAGRPSDLFGDSTLNLFERPWAGGTTQDLLSRMIQDADLAGNSYWFVDDGELVRMRPDWVDIVLELRRVGRGSVGYRRIGYAYYEGGNRQNDPVLFTLREVAHFAPNPDPAASWRGMSWLTPIVREIQADALMNAHKRRFFQNGATPNMVIKHAPERTVEQVKRFKAELDASHQGVENAYKVLHLGGGADVTVVGKDFQQIEFAAVQGHGETRIAAAAGVPPVIVGLSEGLAAATYSNYAQARRRFADGTMHPLWQNAAGSLETLRPVPGRDVRLWYDARDVPFLREDEKDSAVIAETKARTIRTYVDGGYTPESAKAAVESGDEGLLEHTGWFSVQLQRPGGASPVPAPDEGAADA
jgi:HK97 family phage portal protein